jgi:DNA-binding transcriptional LysR family regulator
MIKTQQLIHAKALIEHGTFGRAAQAQNISRPAFSRSIANLENTLGVKLFHRHSTGVTETVFGQILNKYIHQFLTTTSELEREIRIAQGLGMGKLSVALGPFPAEISAHRAVGRLISEFPDLRCKVTVSDWMEVEKLVVARSADLGIAEISEANKNKYLEIEPLVKHKCVLFCRSDHPLLRKKKITKKDIDSYPFVLIKIGKRLASVIPGKLFPVENKDYLLPSIEIEDITLSRQIVSESDAFSAATPFQIKSDLEKGTFSVIPFEAPWLVTNYGFMYLRDRALSPAAEKYMNVVREIERDVEVRNQALLKRYLSKESV